MNGDGKVGREEALPPQRQGQGRLRKVIGAVQPLIARIRLPTFIRPYTGVLVHEPPSPMHIPRAIHLCVPVFTVLCLACTTAERGTEKSAAPGDTTAVLSPAPVPLGMEVPPQASAVADPNPAHGQPGHRCEIPVGASLATAPPPGTVPPPAPASPGINPTPVTINGGATQGNTQPGMNPPHGQPGHDCAVAVGSPLPK